MDINYGMMWGFPIIKYIINGGGSNYSWMVYGKLQSNNGFSHQDMGITCTQPTRHGTLNCDPKGGKGCLKRSNYRTNLEMDVCVCVNSE